MKKTDNYGLALYDKEDKMSITSEENSLNANMKMIDKVLKEKADNNNIPTKLSELDNDKNFLTNEELEDKGYLTEVPSTYKTKTENDDLYQSKGNYANKDELNAKVDKVTGKSLIDDTEIERLANVTNYNDIELRNAINSKASISDMTTYIEEHKEELKGADGKDGTNGQDGKDGENGKDGYTPIKGVDYFDGKDGSNGIDGKDGKDGINGQDGYSPIAKIETTSTGATITITDKNGTTTTNITNGKDGAKGDKGDTGEIGAKGEKGEKGEKGDTGEQGIQGVAGKDGTNGKDGVSITHSWNGTTLTVTSASGTSSADLKGSKGDKGDKGDTGSQGAKGEKGDTYILTDTDKKEIANLVEVEKIPDYVKSEAERVANNVLDVRTGQSLVFAGFSDAHIDYSNESKTSVIHAGMGLKCIREFTNLDMVAHFGDYINGGHESTKAGSKEEYKIYHKAMFDGCNGVTTVYLEGNHDANYQGGVVNGEETDDILTLDELYSFIGSNNQGNHVVEYENQNRLYGYIEFPAKKIRVIYLNSSDGWKTGVTEAQATWLSNTAFDLSKKTDVADWGIVIFIHIPVTFGDNAKILTAINNYSGEAEIIGIFHGHCHNFRTEKVTNKQIWQIGIPELCVGRNNEYAHSSDASYSSIFGEFDSEGNPVHYNKISGTAEDTSFNIVTIDRKNKKIYCHCFGAGYDRTISYGDSGDVTINYGITNNLTNVNNDNTATTIQSGNSYTANLTIDDGYELESVTVTMGGTDVTSTVYANGVINIESVIGNIIITATAISTSSGEETTPYTNLFSSTDADFADAVRFNSSGATTGGSGFVSGYIPAVMGDTIYVRCPGGNYKTDAVGNNIRNICTYKSDKKVINILYPGDTTIDADGVGFSYTIVDANTTYVRVSGHPNGNYANFVVTKNEPIEL